MYRRLAAVIAPIQGLARRSRAPLLPSSLHPPSSQPSSLLIRTARQWHRPRPQYQRFQQSQQQGRDFYSLWKSSPALRNGTGAVVLFGGIIYYVNLEKVPISGRWRFNIISPEREARLARMEYQSIMKEVGPWVLPPDHPSSRQVQRVMAKLLAAAGLDKKDWEVRIINDHNQVNAFVIPGGKAFVFSGILPICESEAGLAAVLGHEIAHNVAHHTSEKLSQRGFLLGLGLILSFWLDISGLLAQRLVDLAFQMPGSRKAESEADYIGLLIMAKACYDPRAAVEVWRRMAAHDKETTPEFLSTHPAHQNRILKIEKWLPQAFDARASSSCSMSNDQSTFLHHCLA